MSERIVMLGPDDGEKMQAAEISPMDAGAFLASDNWRVTLSLWGGPLANATVLMRRRLWGENPRANMAAWESALLMCPHARPFEISLPLTTRMGG